ncbi:hypothetical protein E0D81_04920, partial [Lelliottia amnigena]|uniref:hypothetical protein n=1 Tax=Lelliottia amnigena TaxID=61646 RepID=UPI00103D2379
MTLTKSWLQKQITDLEATRDEIPFGLDEDGNNTLDALKMALAGMKAQPVAMRPSMLFDQFVSSITKGQRGLPDALIKDGVVDYEKIGVLWEEYRSAPQPLTTSERAELENYRNAQRVVPDDGRDQFEEWFKFHRGDE